MVGLVVYWRRSRVFSRGAMLYSLVAYAGAIALKYAVQLPTINAFEASTGGSLVALGVYYGAQTAAFEVGGAYVVARLAVSRSRLKAEDAEGFGLGLAFWENAALLAVPMLLEYSLYYVVLSSPNSLAAQVLYPVLAKQSPGLFLSPAAALPLVGYSILERVSSLVSHFTWGFLCLFAAVLNRKRLFFIALPLGFVIDFLVPFAGAIGLGVFELTIFAISIAALAGALSLVRRSALPGGAGTVSHSPSSNT
ncbi:MAG: YhfC family intramembrane metalloprotease [Nitrososphaerota archaeon]|nr:YhfC family intramembrane metalloprotease [Nitrososphaerota archaeon]